MLPCMNKLINRSNRLLIVVSSVALLLLIIYSLSVGCGKTAGSTSLAAMPTPRAFVCTGVISGEIYALGGATSLSGTVVFSSALERYSPVTNSWTSLAPMPAGSPITPIQATVFDNKLYASAFSMYNSDIFVGSFETYNPDTNTWTRVNKLIEYAAKPVAVNNAIYLFGGVNDGLSTETEAYYPFTGTSEMRASMHSPKIIFGAAVDETDIYLFGGQIGSYEATSEVEKYDTVGNVWTQLTPMPMTQIGPSTAVVGNKIYVFGGFVDGRRIPIQTLEAYDIIHDSWEAVANISRFVIGFPAPQVSGKIYLIGGVSYSNTLEVSGAVEEFTPR